MKRIFLIACAVVAVVSCARNEVVDVNTSDNDNIIKFSTYTNSVTKAGVESTTSIQDYAVGIYAVPSTEDFVIDNLFIPNTALTYSAANGWSSSITYYWPADTNESYKFYGYYPFVGTADMAYYITGLDTEEYYIRNIDDADDSVGSKLRASQITISQTAVDQVDILASGEISPTNGDEVEVVLDHVLSKVDFRFGIASVGYDAPIVVTIHTLSMEGINIAHQGLDLVTPAMISPDEASITASTYTYNATADDMIITPETGSYATVTVNSATEDGTTTYTYTIDDSAAFADGALTNSTTSYMTIDATDDVSAFLMLPQALEYGVQQLKLEYTITQNGVYIVGSADAPYTALLNLCVTDSEGEQLAWEAGKSYLYSVVFDAANLANATPMLFFDTHTEWENETDIDSDNTELSEGEDEA